MKKCFNFLPQYNVPTKYIPVNTIDIYSIYFSVFILSANNAYVALFNASPYDKKKKANCCRQLTFLDFYLRYPLEGGSVTNYTSNINTSQRLELIQGIDNLLTTATQAAGQPIGIDCVKAIILGIYDFQKPTTIAEILDEVEKAGIKLTPGLVIKINNLNPEIVRNALSIYLKVYGKGGGNNPSILFYTILDKQRLNS